MRTSRAEGSPLTPPHPTAYLPSMHHPLAEAPSAAPTDAASPTTPPPTPGAAPAAHADAGAGPVPPPLPAGADAAGGDPATNAAFASDARDLGDAILRAAAERAEAEAITEADWTRAAAAGGVPYPRGGAWPASAIPEQVIIVDQRGRRYERMASGELRRIKGVAPEGEA